MNAFRELNEFNFICKCNAKLIKHKPGNVLLVDWLQQNELLGKDISLVTHQLTKCAMRCGEFEVLIKFLPGNSKVKLVFSHGGLLTMQEAIWHQKLILSMPIDVDQRKNTERAIDLGIAEAIDANNFTSTDIVLKIRMLIESPIYMRNVVKVSQKLMKSSPLGPKATAIHWVEQVLQHNGLNHLKTEARKLSFYKLYMLDITSFAAIIMLIYILIMQYHFIKEWIVKRERRLRDAEDKAMNEAGKLKSE